MKSNSLAALAAATCLGLFCASGPSSVRAQTSPTLTVMDWNIHHGIDTSGGNNLDRVAVWIVRVNPHVVSLNEVEKLNGYNNNADEPAVLEAALESKTGVAWYGCFAQRDGAARGEGNLLLSRMPIQSCDQHLLTASRSVARANLSVNGIALSLFSTHLDAASASTRATQVTQLMTWAAGASSQRILMGDFNASSTAPELQPLNTAYEDAWAAAVAGNTAIAYPGNTAGNTRNGRIDFIWRSKTATKLALQSAQVYDTASISDHRPVAATYTFGPASLTTLSPPRNMRIVGR